MSRYLYSSVNLFLTILRAYEPSLWLWAGRTSPESPASSHPAGIGRILLAFQRSPTPRSLSAGLEYWWRRVEHEGPHSNSLEQVKETNTTDRLSAVSTPLRLRQGAFWLVNPYILFKLIQFKRQFIQKCMTFLEMFDLTTYFIMVVISRF